MQPAVTDLLSRAYTVLHVALFAALVPCCDFAGLRLHSLHAQSDCSSGGWLAFAAWPCTGCKLLFLAGVSACYSSDNDPLLSVHRRACNSSAL